MHEVACQNQKTLANGEEIYRLLERLFPLCRSLTGPGVRDTLKILQEYVPLTVQTVPSGTKAFDWTVPDEWAVQDGFVADENGKRIVDFQKNNLHVMGYSCPVDEEMSLEELQPYLYTLPHMPDAIPYVTSYYKKRWGICLAENVKKSLKPGRYRVKIDSTLGPGVLNYGELVLPGESEEEILLSTYLCHPSMANDSLSGVVMTAALAAWLMQLPKRRYTYRIVFIPETIGSIVYLHRHLEAMKKNTVAGYVITCVGDDRTYSFLPSRLGGTLADRMTEHVLGHDAPGYQRYTFLDYGSDERQYCSPGVDLPIVSLMRSKYATFPEYHTSLDNLEFVSAKGLDGAFSMLKKCLIGLEANYYYKLECICEPQLGKRGLYPDVSTKDTIDVIKTMMNLLSYADGNHDLLAIAEIIGVPIDKCIPIAEKFYHADVLSRREHQYK